MDKDLKKKYEKNNSKKETFIERIFDKLFFAMKRDIKVTFIVLLVLLNVYTSWNKNDCYENRLTDSFEYRENIIKEIRRQVTPLIEKNIQEKTDRIEKKVDSTNRSFDELQETIEKIIRK